MQVKKQQLEPVMEQQTGSNMGKEYIKAVYYHLTYLTSVGSTTCKMPGLDKAQARIKTARRNSNNLRYADDTTLMAENEEELKSLLMKVKKESEKAGLELSIQKPKIMASGSHEMALLLGRKAMTNLESILKSRDITLPTKVCLVKAIVFPVVIAFLLRSKHLLISWLQSLSAVILKPRK